MRESMISQLVTFIDDAPQQVRICLAILANHKERRRHVLPF